MSRTFRRKNYEISNRTSWDNQGGKLAGYYTKKDFHWLDDPICAAYSTPTRVEYFRSYWRIHGDNGYYHSSPSKWYRYTKIHKYRQYDKTELRKFMINEDYEPMCWIRIGEGYWD